MQGPKMQGSTQMTARQADGGQLGHFPGSWILDPVDLVFLEAALAADLSTASISLHIAAAPNPFLRPAVQKNVFSRIVNRYTRTYDAGGRVLLVHAPCKDHKCCYLDPW